MGLTTCVPLADLLPLHAVVSPVALAVQVSALLALHAKVALCPSSMVAGVTVKVTTGAGTGTDTVTSTGSLAIVPPGPVQVKV